jgi:hypothetical protein
MLIATSFTAQPLFSPKREKRFRWRERRRRERRRWKRLFRRRERK